MKKPTILVCESSPNFADVISIALKEKANLVIVSAGLEIKLLDEKTIQATSWEMDQDGKKTPIVWQGWPDLFIFEMRLPGESGIEIWQRLKKPENILFISIFNYGEVVEALTAVGLDEKNFVCQAQKNYLIFTNQIIEKAKNLGVNI